MLQSGPDVRVRFAAREATSVGAMFRLRVIRSGDGPALYTKKDGVWCGLSWRQWYDRSAAVAGAFLALGLEPGETIAILGPTQVPWGVYDMGAQLVGLIGLGIYPKQAVDQVRYLLEHSDCRVVLVSGEEELETVLKAAEGLDGLKGIVPWEEANYAQHRDRDSRLLSPRQFEGEPLAEARIEACLEAISGEDTAALIYTSGTTGPPKGAMIAHRSILHLLSEEDAIPDIFESDISLSFLPMAHAAERILAFYGRISAGLPTAYATSVGAILEELQEVKPTIFGSVPRIFEKAHSKIYGEIEKKPWPIRALFSWAVTVGKACLRMKLEQAPIPPLLAMQHRLADSLVFSKIRAAFGGRIRQLLTGAAPISREILDFFWAAGLPIYECYGMTEATCVTHSNRPGDFRLGSAGRPLSGVEQRLAEDGELLIRGPLVFKGYHKNEAATRATIIDGWLHTGDIAEIDGDGFVSITDRKKHLIITAGGKNIAPANIERAIKGEDPLISQVHPHGDRRPYVSALIAPSPLETLEWGVARGLIGREELQARTRELMENPAGRTEALNQSMARVVTDGDFQARVKRAVGRGNRKLAQVEKVKRFILLDRDFSQEHGELTPTLKVRRRALEERYQAEFDRLYEDGDLGLVPLEDA